MKGRMQDEAKGESTRWLPPPQECTVGPTALQENWDSGKEMGDLSFRHEGVKTQGLKKKSFLKKNHTHTHSHTHTLSQNPAP